MVVGNYLDIEKAMLGIAADYMVKLVGDASWFLRVRIDLTRRLNNLLSSALMYVDHTKNSLSQLYGADSEHARAFVSKTSEQYDKHFAYRLMMELRKHSQHRGFPMSLANVNSKWHDTQNGRQMSITIGFNIDVSDFEMDSKFKKAVLRELEETGPVVDLKPMMRGFVEAIANLHEATRDITDSDVEESRSRIFEYADKYFDEESEPEKGRLDLVRYESRGDVAEHHPLPTISEQHRIEVRKSNSIVNRLGSRYVTGR